MKEQTEREWLWGAAALDTLRSFDAVIELNSVGMVASWNERAQELFGTRHDDETGEHTLADIVSDANRFELDTAILAANEPSEAGVVGWRGQLDLVAAGGVAFRGDLTIIPAPDEMAGGVLLVVQVPSHLAGPAHRRDADRLVDVDKLHDLLAHAFSRTRHADESLAVLRIDLDGPDAAPARDEAEAILCRIAGDVGVVAAIGPASFVLLCDSLQAPFFAANLADRIAVDLRPLGTASIGIGFLADAGVAGAADILDHAEQGLARAREAGGDRAEIFDPTVREVVIERRRVRDELYRAIDAGDFRVHYQPANDLAAGRITMVEALVRWDHPTRGLIAAGEFLDLAEESGLILPLGAWVLHEACRQLRAWLDEFGDSAPVVVVNFSEHQLHHPAAAQLVAGVVDANGLDPGRLCIELAESALVADPARTAARLHELRALGIRLSIDHFGVSPASSAHLEGLPVDLVKVDRSLVNALGDEGTRAAAGAVVALAHSLGVAVAAEGVETAEQFDAMRELGCDQIQGFLVARPQSPEDISKLVTNELAGESTF